MRRGEVKVNVARALGVVPHGPGGVVRNNDVSFLL